MTRALVYFTAMLLGNAVAMPLGGVFNGLVGLSFTIPYIGPVLAVLFNRKIRLTLLAKLAAWAISASGLFLSYLAVERLLGPPKGYQWIGLSAAAAIVAMDISWRIVMFQPFPVPTLRKVMENWPAFIRSKMMGLSAEDIAPIHQQTFADMNFPAVLQLLVAFGMLLFGLGHLHWIKIPPAILKLQPDG